MATDERKVQDLASGQREMDTPPEETMEYWLSRSVGDIEEGEVIRGRVVEVRTGDVIVDIGYKSEGAIPMPVVADTKVLPESLETTYDRLTGLLRA